MPLQYNYHFTKIFKYPQIYNSFGDKVKKYQVLEREVDPQGRVLLPKEWRNELGKQRKVLLLQTPEYVKILPKGKADLTRYSNSIKVDLKAPLTDWHAVKAELLSKKYIRDKK